jgi:hypothetical protein
MQTGKRFIVASIGGLICGVICYSIASSGPAALPAPIAAQIIASRTLIGVAIGLSRFSFGHWAIHGVILGGLFSLPLAFSGLMAPDNPQFSPSAMFIWTVVLGMVYGLLIELVTSVLLKLRVPRAPQPPVAA